MNPLNWILKFIMPMQAIEDLKQDIEILEKIVQRQYEAFHSVPQPTIVKNKFDGVECE